MKRLRDIDDYPAELWEGTSVPNWSAERVWAGVERQRQVSPQRWRWRLWLCVLAVVLGSVRWVGEEEIFEDHQIRPATQPEIRNEEELVSEPVSKQLKKSPSPVQEHPVGELIPTESPQMRESEEHMKKLTPIELKDSTAVRTPGPIAELELPYWIPLLPRKPIDELKEVNTLAPLPTEVRPGTKLVLKVPEIPAAEARQGAFVKRLWQQYKRLNTEGTIDWVELGIQPNGDGTFSILPPAKNDSNKPN